MACQNCLELMNLLEAEKSNRPGGWIETRQGNTGLLVYENENPEDKFCLMVMHCVTDQGVLRTFFEIAKKWGYNSPAYMTGYNWDCAFLDVRVFFEKKEEGLCLQKRTDQIIKKMADEINFLTKKWGEQGETS